MKQEEEDVEEEEMAEGDEVEETIKEATFETDATVVNEQCAEEVGSLFYNVNHNEFKRERFSLEPEVFS